MGLVYKITNLVNQKIYVGKTTASKADRWSQHKSRARHVRRNHYLYNAMRKHGIDNFALEVLEDGISDDDLDAREIDWIAKLKSADSKVGYNCTPGGDGAKHGPSSKCRQRGWRVVSDETRQKISRAHKGRKHDPERVERMKAGLRGKKQSKEAIANRSNSLREAFKCPATKAKLSEIAKQRCADGNKFWKAITPESIARAEAKRKQWRESPEGLAFRKRISERHKGKKNSEALKKGWETRRARLTAEGMVQRGQR